MAAAQIVADAGWEKGDLYQNVFSPFSVCTPHGATISNEHARKGKHAVRFELRATDTICGYSKRSELYIHTSASQELRWYAWSEYIPADYQTDKLNEVHFQLHHTSAAGGPPVIGLWLSADKWKLVQTFDTINVFNKNRIIKQHELGPVAKGRWTDWVLYTNFSLDQKGRIKLWKNGKLVLDIKGANFNRENGVVQKNPYMKFGIYKWQWLSTPGPFNPAKRVVFFDEIKVGKEGCTLQEMQPGAKPKKAKNTATKK
ncbi:MAG: hypothetical protein RL172_667 [Bacteroidota bacterium]|jgi:hypothetical protein